METSFALIITIGIIIILLVLFLLALKFARNIPADEKDKIVKAIDDIKYSMALHNPSANRDGIVRLDALLSKALQLRNRNTLNCGDNLKISKSFIPKTLYNDIWYYHKMRNQIVHENIEVKNDEAINSFKVYSEVIFKLLK